MLWPILHYRLDLAEFSSRDLAGYLRVNEHFADRLHKFLRPDDVHLGARLSSAAARQGAARARPSRTGSASSCTSRFRRRTCSPRCPSTSASFSALCHYDLVGFQTDNDADNFARYLTNECRMPSRDRAHVHRRRAHGADRRVPGRRRNGGVRAAGAAHHALAVRARGARQPGRARHDHRRRPARLFQGHRAADGGVRALPRRLSALARHRHLSADHAAQPLRDPANTPTWSARSTRRSAASTAATARRRGRRSATSTGPTAAPRWPASTARRARRW